MALEPFVSPTSAEAQTDPVPLEYLQDKDYSSYDITLEVAIQATSETNNTTKPETVCRSNFKNLYWNAAQQLVHHSVTGCIMQPGDLLGSGTISGSSRDAFGSMLELCWKGTREVALGDSGEVRKFLKDGDTVVMKGWCRDQEGNSSRVGFGDCSGKVLPAILSNGGVSKESTVSATKEQFTNFKLYSYFKSSASWRVRIALNAKGISYEIIPVNLKNDEHKDSSYIANRNPMAQVPTLECVDTTTDTVLRISQSVAIMEFLDEAFPGRPALYPSSSLAERALAREMVEIVNSGIQPLQNMSLMRELDARSEGKVGWNLGAERIAKGLAALEELVTKKQHEKQQQHKNTIKYSLGGFAPTAVDFCIIPQLHNARHVFKVDMTPFPALVAIETACSVHPWFLNAHPNKQTDAE